MRVAVYSDVHGNTPGLEAVHNKIDAIGRIDQEICLGDLFYGGPGTVEVLTRLHDRRVVMVRGNHEEDLGDFDNVLPTLPLTHRLDASNWHQWLASKIPQSDMLRLSSLPMTHQIELPEGVAILFCHSSPTDTRIILLGPDAPAANRAKVFAEINADILCIGHWHEQAILKWNSLQVVGVGGVGLSPDGLSRWMLLESDKDSVRFLPQITPYDVEEFQELARACDMPRVTL
jgi:predicted phosphodiesterase